MLPLPRLTPLRDAAPACTTMLSTPVLVKSRRIADQAPVPISAIASSDPTPMMMPSVVERRAQGVAAERAQGRGRRPRQEAEVGADPRRPGLGNGASAGAAEGSRLRGPPGDHRRSAARGDRRSRGRLAGIVVVSTPSRIRMMRPACAATEGSWVTRTIVRPSSRLSCRKSARISSPVLESRLPVGSSAIRSEQPLISARAIATRCCSPPESRPGSWSSRSPRPTRSSSSLARPRHAALRRLVRPVGERHHHVLEGGQPGQQVEVLEDEADPAAPQPRPLRLREPRDVPAVHPVAAGGRAVQEPQQVDQRRLARARRPHQRDHLPAHDRERDPPEHGHLDRAPHVDLVDIAQRDEVHGRRSGAWSSFEGSYPSRFTSSEARSRCAAGSTWRRRPCRPGWRRRRPACPRSSPSAWISVSTPSERPIADLDGPDQVALPEPDEAVRLVGRCRLRMTGLALVGGPAAECHGVGLARLGDDILHAGLPAQGRVGDEQDVAAHLDLEGEAGRQVGQEPAARVVHRDDHRIGHDVLVHAGVQADLRDLALERLARQAS